MKIVKKLILFCVMVAASAVMFSVTAFAATTVTGGSFSGRLDGHTGEEAIDNNYSWKDSIGTQHYILKYDWVTDIGSGSWIYPINVPMNGPTSYGPTYTIKCPWLSVHKTPPDITANWNTGAWHNTIDDMSVYADSGFAHRTADGRSWSGTLVDGTDDVEIYVDVNKTASYNLAGHWVDGSGGIQPIYPQFFLDGKVVLDESLRSWAVTTSNGTYSNWTNYYEYADLKWDSVRPGYNSYNQGYNKMNVLACDTYGNIAYKEYPFYYDSVPPSIYLNSNPSGWTASNPTFSFGATDATSGVAHVWYRTTSDGSNWSGWTESSSCTIYGQGGYQVEVMACDNAGNYSYATSNWVYVDHLAPTVGYNPPSSGWINHSLNVTVTPSDPWCSSGMQFTGYNLSNDGGSSWSGWTNVSGGSPFTLTLQNGDNIIDCNPYDNVGHVSDVRSGHYYIDTVAPVGKITPSTTDYTPSLNLQFNADDTVMYNNTGQIKCTNRDTYVPGTECKTPYWPTGSNFQGVTFRVSGQIKKIASADDSKTTSVGFFYSPGNGASNYNWIAAKTWTLSSLNSSWSTFSATITIPADCGASASDLIPWIQIGVPWGSAGYEVDLQGLKYEVVTASGVNHVVNPDGSTVAGSSSSYTVTENGTYSFKAVDNAGNVSSFSYTVSNIAHGNLTGTIEVSDHYYENTDVTGAVDIQYTNQAPVDITPSMGITVRIMAGSQAITQTILCPPNNHSYIPFKFRTPDNPGSSSSTMTIKAEIDPDNKLHETNENDNVLTKQISIDNAEYSEPPVTTYQPTAPSSWHETDAGSYPSTNTLSWQEWRFENNALVLKNFNVTAAATVQLTPDPRATSSTFDESSNIWTMRSGYGFGNTTMVHVTTNYDRPELITLPQRIRVYFPEFGYDQQNNLRELEQTAKTGTTADYTVTYSFRQNPQSKALARLHFTPLWFPDGDYNVLENARDIWTPGGQLNMWGTTTMNISGSVYDDWYAGLVPNQ